MTAIRQALGWISWLVVATVLYAITWNRWDHDLRFAVPNDVGLWFCDALGVASLEGTYDVFIWATSILAVLALHAVTWAVFSLGRRTLGLDGNGWPSALRRSFPAIGWTSWLLVSTFAILLIGDAIHEAHGGRLSNDPGEHLVEFVVGLLVVGFLHVAARGLLAARHWRPDDHF